MFNVCVMSSKVSASSSPCAYRDRGETVAVTLSFRAERYRRLSGQIPNE